MTKTTTLVEGALPVALERDTVAFYTGSMGDCDSIVVSNGTHSMGQHCSGGLRSGEFKQFFGSFAKRLQLDNRAVVKIIFASGSMGRPGPSLRALTDLLGKYKLTTNIEVSVYNRLCEGFIFPNGKVYDMSANVCEPEPLYSALVKYDYIHVIEESYWRNSSLRNIKATTPINELDGRRWAADNSSDNCTVCSTKFSLLTRRHHCRRCGCLVCSSCYSKRHLSNPIDKIDKDGKPMANKGARTTLVCTNCRDVLDLSKDMILKTKVSSRHRNDSLFRV